MSESGVAELAGATLSAGITAVINMQMRYQCRNEYLCTENGNEASNLHTETVYNGESTAAAKPLNQHANYMPNLLIGNQQMEAYMKGLDAGDATAMYELACCCLNDSISDELVHRIAYNTTFRAYLNILARKYALGLAEPDNDQEAFLVLKYAESLNDPDILCALGRSYNFGWGIEKDVSKAVECYVKAADAGSFEAIERLSGCKNDNVDEQLKAAFEHFSQQAAAGDANAIFAAAYCYYLGMGVDKNYQLAMEMCQAAAKYYNTNAMVLPGYMYRNEYGVEKNDAKAVGLYIQAAEAGNAEGQYQLGVCYDFAVGIAEDREQAAFWYEKAAAQGHAGAADSLGDCYENSYGVDKDLAKAFYYNKQAAIAGNDCGLRYTGDCYYSGKGVELSYKRAAYWYYKAVDQGYDDSVLDLDRCFTYLRKTQGASASVVQTRTAQSVCASQQHRIAFYLARLAAWRGCNKVCSCLGDCYLNGIGIGIDFTAAAKYYERVEPYDSQKYLNLVKCLETGEVEDRNEIDLMYVLSQANAALRREINYVLSQMQ